MARNPLYPKLPGETALDRLVNDTIPNLIRNRNDRLERERDREDRLRQQKLNNEFREREFRLREQTFNKSESDSVKNKVETIMNRARQFAVNGQYDLATNASLRAKELAEGNKLITSQDMDVFGFDEFDTFLEKGMTNQNNLKDLDSVWSDESSTSEEIERAYNDFMYRPEGGKSKYDLLDSTERVAFQQSMNTYQTRDPEKFRGIINPELSIETHNKVLELGPTTRYGPAMLNPTELNQYNKALNDYISPDGKLYSDMNDAEKLQAKQIVFNDMYAGKVSASADQYFLTLGQLFQTPEELTNYYDSLNDSEKKRFFKEMSTAGAAIQKDKEDFLELGIPEEAFETEKDGDNGDNGDKPKRIPLEQLEGEDRADRYITLSKKEYSLMSDVEQKEMITLYQEFKDKRVNQSGVKTIQKNRARIKKIDKEIKFYEGGYIDNYTRKIQRFQNLLDLGPASKNSKGEKIYIAPANFGFSGGWRSTEKEILDRMRSLESQRNKYQERVKLLKKEKQELSL